MAGAAAGWLRAGTPPAVEATASVAADFSQARREMSAELRQGCMMVSVGSGSRGYGLAFASP